MRRVIITGGSNGIGAACVTSFALAGDEVFFIDKDDLGGEKLVALIAQENKSATFLLGDITKSADIDAALHKIFSQSTKATSIVLINNAGYGGPFSKTTDTSPEEWDYIFNVNVKSAFLLTRAVLPRMSALTNGRIINISSLLGLFGGAQSSTYSAAKHALIGYTKSIAAEWGAAGITCNAICPGFVETTMGATQAVDSYREKVMARTPTKTIASPQEVADLVFFLARAESRYINGSIYTIDGGISADAGIL